jgi:GxxExxY protein
VDEPLRHEDTELKTINNITETADTEVDEPLRHEDTELKTINITETEATKMDESPRNKDTELEAINKVTERVIGCAIEVHRVLRCGLFEAIYRSALAIEFDSAGLTYRREARLPALYKGRLLGQYYVDFIVADLVIVEIKSVEKLNPIFETQVLTYIRLAEKRVGLLINFNSRLVRDGIKRLIV